MKDTRPMVGQSQKSKRQVATNRERLLTVERLPDPPVDDLGIDPPCELPHPPGQRVIACPGLERLPDPITTDADTVPMNDTMPETNDRDARLRRMQELRQQYLDSGGTLLTAEEVNREVAERRGERYTEE
ncbi:MAG: hypothetical protein R3C19_26830 [Planctomycetaceae bacterium]